MGLGRNPNKSMRAEGSGQPNGLAILLDDNFMEPSGVVTNYGCAFGDSALLKQLRYIFDFNVSHKALVDSSGIDFKAVTKALEQKVETYGETETPSSDTDEATYGRHGPRVVRMDPGNSSGDILFDDHHLSLSSQSNFSSSRANTCVAAGMWMFEVTLGTAGIQQLGWATDTCPFTNEEGVGDAPDSYAYDGKRVKKWSVSCQPYGQAWVAGDVIGCCLDVGEGQITFYRNGVSLGVAFSSVRRSGVAYFPAVSLSHGERCEINFGSRPLRYPVESFQPLQAPAPAFDRAAAPYLLVSLQRLLRLATGTGTGSLPSTPSPTSSSSSSSGVTADSILTEQRARFSDDDCALLAAAILHHLGPLLVQEYIICSSVIPALMTLYYLDSGNTVALRRAVALFFTLLEPHELKVLVPTLFSALARLSRTSFAVSLSPKQSSAHEYLELAGALARDEAMLAAWVASPSFHPNLEDFLTRKQPNSNDLAAVLPVVHWPGATDETCAEDKMKASCLVLMNKVERLEELQMGLCRTIMWYTPKDEQERLNGHRRGSLFRTFLRRLLRKNQGCNRNQPPAGLSDNSVLVSTYFTLLLALSPSFHKATEAVAKQRALHQAAQAANPDAPGDDMSGEEHSGGAALQGSEPRPAARKHGQPQSIMEFPPLVFLQPERSGVSDVARLGGTESHLHKTIPLAAVDRTPVNLLVSVLTAPQRDPQAARAAAPAASEESSAGASTSGAAASAASGGAPGGGASAAAEQASSGGGDGGGGAEAVGASSSSAGKGPAGGGDAHGGGGRDAAAAASTSSNQALGLDMAAAMEAHTVELVDALLMLYQFGMASNFKQASYHLQSQAQSIAQLKDTDRRMAAPDSQLRGLSVDQVHMRVRHLKEVRAVFREDVVESVRVCAWCRATLFTRWKQEAMFHSCGYVVALLLAASRRSNLFTYIPEFYVEASVDAFHTLRRGDPPFNPPPGVADLSLEGMVTFLVMHFNDKRIVNPDIREVLLQSISVLLQYEEYVRAFEANAVSRRSMVTALMSSFDARFWIPISNILLRLVRGSGFGDQARSGGVECASPVFQAMLCDTWRTNQGLFSSFLNRIFNTVNWTITEFSVAMKEMQEAVRKQQHSDLQQQQRKCTIMFELSVNLVRILEFITLKVSSAFITSEMGMDINLTRLCESLCFVLNHTTVGSDARPFNQTLELEMQQLEKINRAAILAPCTGILLNLYCHKPSAPAATSTSTSTSAASSSSSSGSSSAAASSSGAAGGGGSAEEGPGEREAAAARPAGTSGPPAAAASSTPSGAMCLLGALANMGSTCSLDQFRFLADFAWTTAFPKDKSLARLPSFQKMVWALEEEMQRRQKEEESGAEAEMCTICYATPVDTSFLPCEHESCRRCISRQLLNTSRCFFCNANVDFLVSLPDGVKFKVNKDNAATGDDP